MRLFPPLLATIALFLAVSACGGKSDRGQTAVPLPVGYPRIATADTIYRIHDIAGAHIEFNAEATVAVDSVLPSGAAWLTVSYPQYPSARLYVTVSPEVDTTAIANRRQRMELNSGGMPSEITTITTAATAAEMQLTSSGSATPLQFLAVGHDRLISGAFFIEAAVTTPDSVRPIVEAVRGDLLHLITTLK